MGGPTTIGTGAYRKEYNEVEDLGGNGLPLPGGTPTLRRPSRPSLRCSSSVNPVEMFNRTFRGISTSEGLTLVEQARLFAMLNLSGADAAIGCWDDKEYWAFWRPITAIRSGTRRRPEDGRRHRTGRRSVASPPYPDHPSGYNCVTGSFMYAAKAFFGKEKLEFDLDAGPSGSPDATRPTTASPT